MWGPRSSRAHIDLVVIMMEINIKASAKSNIHLPPVPITYLQPISPPTLHAGQSFIRSTVTIIDIEKIWSSETTGWDSDWPMTQIDWLTGSCPRIRS